MIYRGLASLVWSLHLAFILFVVLGGLLVLRWRRLAWVHLPVVVWGAGIMGTGLVCPLTPLEKWLRRQSGLPRYEGGFVEHYLLPALFPSGMSRGAEIAVGLLVLAINVGVYGWIGLRAARFRVER